MSRAPSLRRRHDIPVPAQCRNLIDHGALVVVNSSGGKDSQAMTILLERIVPRDQLLVVHAPLGEVEWPGTIEHIERTIPPGVPFILAPVASGRRATTSRSTTTQPRARGDTTSACSRRPPSPRSPRR